jgi:hypothetical protein
VKPSLTGAQRDWLAIASWNVVLYALSVGLTALAIQHAVFFYSWPPDVSRYTDVPLQVYFIAGAGGYIMLKVSHIVERAAQVIRLRRNSG